eukprot:CAMPEP_0197825698 /NCGR_PEP_ID=MMETSP1437-20131217/2739_1 /TAXON_ID=49252 ORGANISM="Eucampia antarctica, Strain CCMP1452" /NCGR_SAMPLE_ID=MMETSP1437 /ASSEMBLY_ACC=CAM_ASM_001096 /LENGTH=252 /DNA_ID=CAMNT_0043425811 /DNA_START=115 /DNA_END=873 /DNA_ORIENTATION=-
MKTLQQTKIMEGSSSSSTSGSKQQGLSSLARQLYTEGGIRAFYRGGLPLLMGGGLMRSAQFGVYHSSLDWMHSQFGRTKVLWWGCIDPQIVAAGFCGGIGRAMVESPFEIVKVRRQVQTTPIVVESVLEFLRTGAVATLARNGLLFSSFVVYMDLARKADVFFVDSHFLMGGICASMAWFTVWPLDVVKSRIQSGQFDNRKMRHLLADIWHSGHLYRGIVPGITRSFISNGSSMVVYKYVETQLRQIQSKPS